MSTQQNDRATGVEKPEHGWLPMLFIGLGVALIIMDTTVVNVSLPSMIRDLGLSSIDAEWVNAVYSLTFAALLIIWGRIGDRFGRRRIFVIGAVLFGAASILAASSSTDVSLIGARAAQGMAGAMMSPTSLSMVNALYRGRARAIAFALYGSIIGGMAAVGPLVGGFVTEHYSWTWAFWINVPLALLIVVGTLRVVPESKDAEDTGRPDFLGAALSAVGIAALVFALIEGRNYGWWLTTTPSSIGPFDFAEGSLSPVAYGFLAAAVMLPTLYFWETALVRRTGSALIDFSLFRIKTFGLGSLAAGIVSLGEFGLLFSVPLYLQSVLGYSALGAGALLTALAAGSFVAAPTAANFALRFSPRAVAQLGMALEVIGIIGLGLTLSPSATAPLMAFWLFIYGMGVGYASAQLTGLILADVPVRQSGQASGTQSTARQIGSAMGTAVLGTVLFLSLNHDSGERFRDLGMPPAVADEIATVVEKSAGTAIPSLDQPPRGSEELKLAAEEAFSDSITRTALVAGGFVSLGLLATLALPSGRSRREDEPTVEAGPTPTAV